MLLFIVILLGGVIGGVLGLLGGGGAILTVPVLTALGEPAAAAVATSLLVVGSTALVGAVGYARRGNVDGKAVLVFGAPSFLGAALGSRLGHQLPGPVVLVAFALVMLAAAFGMLRGRAAPSTAPTGPCAAPPRRGHLALLGGVVGLVTGVVGAGGGFVMVPALTRAGLPLPRAIGTSLVLIAATCAVALASLGPSAPIDWHVAAPMAASAMLASLVGARAACRVSASRLRLGFAVLVLVTGLGLLLAQLPPRGLVIGVPLAVALAAGMMYLTLHERRRTA